ncbi:MAG: hypothetical protein LBB88_00540, partial [Planctomycetaceae bacterium]|nr:hypothetical protein [Planctomycetaceae bacterium]
MKNTKQLKKNLSNKKRNKEKLLITNDKGYAYYRFSYEKTRYKISLGKYGSPESETNYYLFK